MERGKGGITGWSAGAFRTQTSSTSTTNSPQSDSAHGQGSHQGGLASSVTVDRGEQRRAEIFGGLDSGGRYSSQHGGIGQGSSLGTIAGSTYDVVIASGCTVQGKLELKGRALVNARVEGELSNDQELVIGEQGSIEGNLTGGAIVVFGRVKGDISCSTRLELRGGASVIGNLASPSLVIEDGVVFEGHCRMWDPRAVTGDKNARPEDEDDFEEGDSPV